MPAGYKIYRDLKVKFVDVSQDACLDELLPLARQYFDDPEYDPGLRFLVDLSGVTGSTAQFADVFQLHQFYSVRLRQQTGRLQVAVVAPSDLGYGLTRMFVAALGKASKINVALFDTRADAAGWMNIPRDVAQAFCVDGLDRAQIPVARPDHTVQRSA